MDYSSMKLKNVWIHFLHINFGNWDFEVLNCLTDILKVILSFVFHNYFSSSDFCIIFNRHDYSDFWGHGQCNEVISFLGHLIWGCCQWCCEAGEGQSREICILCWCSYSRIFIYFNLRSHKEKSKHKMYKNINALL